MLNKNIFNSFQKLEPPIREPVGDKSAVLFAGEIGIAKLDERIMAL